MTDTTQESPAIYKEPQQPSVSQETKENDPKQEIQTEYANICAMIGDKQFRIKLLEKDIELHNARLGRLSEMMTKRLKREKEAVQ